MNNNFKNNAKYSLLFRTKQSYKSKLESYLKSKYKNMNDKSSKRIKINGNTSSYSKEIQ